MIVDTPAIKLKQFLSFACVFPGLIVVATCTIFRGRPSYNIVWIMEMNSINNIARSVVREIMLLKNSFPLYQLNELIKHKSYWN